MPSIWLVDKNPFQLPEPPQWWQDMVYDYDKMLRILPSQTEACYRLARIVRQEARLGLNAMVVHDHPDTRAMINFGVVPVASVHSWAINSDKIIRDLRARDLWNIAGGDPNKIVDLVEGGERRAAEAQQAEADGELDERNTSAYRAIKYGRPELFDIKLAHERQGDAGRLTLKPALPPLPPFSSAGFASEAGIAPDVDDELQNRVPSATLVAQSPSVDDNSGIGPDASPEADHAT